MDWRVVFFASYESILSIVFGLITIVITTKVLERTILHVNSENSLKTGNVSLGLFGGTLKLCILLLVQSSILPSISALQTMVLGNQDITLKLVFISFTYFLFFYAITLIISMIALYLCTETYMMATTHVDEVKELKENNIAIAVIFSMVVLGMTLFIRPSIGRFISSLVNYQALEAKSFLAPAPSTDGMAAPPKKPVMPE